MAIDLILNCLIKRLVQMAEETGLDKEIMKVVLKSVLETARQIHHPTDDDTRIDILLKAVETLEEKYPGFGTAIEEAESTYEGDKDFMRHLMLELKRLGSAHNDPKNIPGIKNEKHYNKMMHNPREFRDYISKYGTRVAPRLYAILSSAGYC